MKYEHHMAKMRIMIIDQEKKARIDIRKGAQKVLDRIKEVKETACDLHNPQQLT